MKNLNDFLSLVYFKFQEKLQNKKLLKTFEFFLN